MVKNLSAMQEMHPLSLGWEDPLESKEIKPVILKKISPEYSLEELMLKLQYFGHMMQRVNSLEKTDAGKD